MQPDEPGAIASKASIFYARLAKLVRPSPHLLPDEWAAKNRHYGQASAIPGPRNPYLTPYIVEPARMIASAKYHRVVLVFGAQTGKSEMLLDVAGQRLDQKPAPILYVGPTSQFIREQFEPRVLSLLEDAPALARKLARGKRMTKTRKTVGGVPFRLAHSGSSSALKSDPAALALIDEYDEMISNVNEQGGPLGLVERRGDTYPDFVCAVTSTPKRGMVSAEYDMFSKLAFWKVAEPTELNSPIWGLWQAGTRWHWCWPCPHCEEYFVPRFNLMRWPEKSKAMEAGRRAFLECPTCGGVIENDHKEYMNNNGLYVAPGQTVIEGKVHGDPPDTMTASYWVSGLASPFVSFGDRIRTYVEAIELGDDGQMQQAINAGFGELYDAGGGEAPDWEELMAKSKGSTYERGTVPDGVVYLTLGVDVQRQALPWVIRGWGARGTSWLIDYGYIRGPTAEEEIWEALADLLTTPVGGMNIRLALVDSGFRPGKKDTLPLNRVYEFCRRFKRTVRPSKGSSSAMRTPLILSKIEVNRAGKPFGLTLTRLDTDHWKSYVHERAGWPHDHPGAWHLPKGVDADYCHQVVSESRIVAPNGRPEWIVRGKDNHFLDCEAMLAGAGHLLNVQRIPLPATERDDTGKSGRVRERAMPSRPPQPAAPFGSAVASEEVAKTRRPMPRRFVIRSNYMRS